MEDKKTEGEKKVFFFEVYNKVEMLLVYPMNRSYVDIVGGSERDHKCVDVI